MEKTLINIASSYSVSGDEFRGLEEAKKYLDKYADVQIDANGNLYAELGNKDSDYTIMLDAHADQIGFIVTYIDEKGFVKVSSCGGIDRRVIPGSAVTIIGEKSISAIVCCMPPHLTSAKENSAPSADSIWLDTGLSKEEVEKLISLGDRAVLYCEPKKLLNSKITGLSLDNSCGVATLIKVAEALSKEKLNVKVTILLSAQEETGFSGARTGTYKVSPDEAVVLDVSFALQTGVTKEESGELSKGPMIGISPVLNKDMFNALKEVAVENNIPYQIEVMPGSTGTNADVVSVTKSGVKTAVLSIPLRNMHTQAEIIDLNDMEQTADLIAKYVIKRSAAV